jgi:hypothetical protein
LDDHVPKPHIPDGTSSVPRPHNDM